MTDFPRHSGGSLPSEDLLQPPGFPAGGNRVGSECPSVGTFCPRLGSTSDGSGGSVASSGRGRGQVQDRGRLWGSKSGSRSKIAAASVADFLFSGSIRGVEPLELSDQWSLPQSLTMPPPRGETHSFQFSESHELLSGLRTLAPKLSLPLSSPIPSGVRAAASE